MHRLHLEDQFEYAWSSAEQARPGAFLNDLHTQWIHFLVVHYTKSNWNDYEKFWGRNWKYKIRSWTACIKYLWSSILWAQYLGWDFTMKKKLLLGQGIKIEKNYDIKTQNRWKKGLHLQGCNNSHALERRIMKYSGWDITTETAIRKQYIQKNPRKLEINRIATDKPWGWGVFLRSFSYI